MTPPAGDRRISARLPDFPWDSLADARARAAAHPDGIVDLSVGTPVDPVPAVVQQALTAAADSPGYPVTVGKGALREAMVGWLSRRCGVSGLGADAVLPSIGSKEMVASLALHLGLGPGDRVVVPSLAYPTYEVGARLAGCDVVVTDGPEGEPGAAPALVWVNSPANPTGRVLSADRLAGLVSWCRSVGAWLVSDECYVELGWDTTPTSVLHPDVCGGDVTGLIALHSLSKRSNLAGYRAAFAAGDPALLAELLAVRKNLGLMAPQPVQHAATAALRDDAHVEEQRARYAARRDVLRSALTGAGLRVDHSEAGLYLWATRGEPCADTVAWLADRGILVAPGSFYGPAGARHVRVALTATDERVAAAADRLAG